MAEYVFIIYRQLGELPTANDIAIGSLYCTKSEIDSTLYDLNRAGFGFRYYARIA